MKKRYEVAGMMEWHPVFKTGRSHLQVSFTGGNLCGGATTAAAYETSDAVVQRVIEKSDHFKRGRIKLARIMNLSDRSVRPTQPSVKENCPDTREEENVEAVPVVIEYENIGELRNLLHYNHNLPLSKLLDESSCRKEAENLGITIVKKV